MRLRLSASTGFLLLFFFLQIGLWTQTKKFFPDMHIVPEVPGQATIEAMSLGDKQFYFRTLAFTIQNAGDTFGRFTALREYDYNKLYHWFMLLDSLDDQSHFIPSLAGYYYSQTQNTADVRYVVDYLVQHAEKDPQNKWWWMSQAVYLANHKLKDKDLALEIAYKLASYDIKGAPLWVKQMPAFIHEQLGELDEALIIIRNILDNVDTIDPGEINFMLYFLKERLDKVQESNKYEHLKKPLDE